MKTDWNDLTFRFDEEETELAQNIVDTYEQVTSKLNGTISFLINRRDFLGQNIIRRRGEIYNHGRRQKVLANYQQPLLHMFGSCYTSRLLFFSSFCL